MYNYCKCYLSGLFSIKKVSLHIDINSILAHTLSVIICDLVSSGLVGNLSGSNSIEKSCTLFDVSNGISLRVISVYSACSSIDCCQTISCSLPACYKHTSIDYSTFLDSACVPVCAALSSHKLCNLRATDIDYCSILGNGISCACVCCIELLTALLDLAVFSGSGLVTCNQQFIVNQVLCAINFQLFCSYFDVIDKEYFTTVSLFNGLFYQHTPQCIDSGALSLVDYTITNPLDVDSFVSYMWDRGFNVDWYLSLVPATYVYCFYALVPLNLKL
jgi:hypothetical protein